jgi:hypothetical protein
VHSPPGASVLSSVPHETVEWLLSAENPAVAVLTRRTLLGEADDESTADLWAHRNDYPPVTAILEAMQPDGAWDVPSRDYQKYRGSLWQIHLLGELWANGDDERVQRAASYAFTRQKADGGWSANPNARYDMPCLTANVGRAMARLGWARDERIAGALESIIGSWRRLGYLGCSEMTPMSLNGYCHMLTPKVLLFLGEVPSEVWPEGAEELRDACVEALRDKEVYRSLPAEFKEFQAEVWPLSSKERPAARERFVSEHEPLHYGDKPGWARFGYPLSYNSDALESLVALMAVGEPPRDEYAAAIELVRSAADEKMRWALRTTFNGKMYANVERKGQPSRWLTLRALQVLGWAAGSTASAPGKR